MPQKFDYFVLFAEMRTGSNFLEENINSFGDLKCWGEVFNPAFIGKSNQHELLGVSKKDRERDPLPIIGKIRENTEGLAGFRFFHDHDPRVLNHVLADPKCAKIILTRNPLDSYVSRKIAAETGQWRLGDLKDAKSAQISFVASEFQELLDELKGFQMHLMHEMQKSGQTAFYINYDDIQDIDVINGLARFLGSSAQKDKTTQKTKVQNPSSIENKVKNYAEMVQSLSTTDHFNLSNTPNFEPRRGPAVPTYMAGVEAPLLYMPVRCGPELEVQNWLSALDGAQPSALVQGFTQKTLRQWKRKHKGHKSFTVVAHPVRRLHRAFCRYIVNVTGETYGSIRESLRTTYGLPLPAGAPDADYSLERHREGFLKFADFVKGNLGGQTSIRIDGVWASQSEVIKGFADFSLPDVIVREETIAEDLPFLAQAIGYEPVSCDNAAADTPFALDDIYDEEIESAVRSAYQRDYMMFGFEALK